MFSRLALITSAIVLGLAATAQAACTLPTQPKDRIHVVGNREVNGYGRTWTPYGISVYGGLQDGDSLAAWQPTVGVSMAQIKAAPFWHSNTVRVQWAEANVFSNLSPGESVNTDFLQALCAQVQQVRAQHEVAVLNDNTEFPDWGEYDPTQRTEAAWQAIYDEFGNQPGLIYDVFNEPRLKLSEAGRKRTPANVNWLWRLWRNGGQVNGRAFIGMQTLVNYVRGLGYRNEIWIDPPMLEGLGKYSQFAIHDPLHNTVPTFHHGGLPTTHAADKWYHSFGYLAGRYPVVDGEWNQAAAPTSECNPHAYQVVPSYLRYLHRKHIGLLVWSLQPGSMVAEPRGKHMIATNITQPYETTNPQALEHPSQMRPSYACDKRHVGEGTGQWILNYFRRYN